MGWIIGVIAVIVIVSLVRKAAGGAESQTGDSKQKTEERTYFIDEQDPDNPMYEEMQEEFFDEFEDR